MKFRFLSMLMHSESSQRKYNRSKSKAERKIAKGMIRRKEMNERNLWITSETEFCLFVDDETQVMKL